jgi:hypothetical protein
MKYEYKTFWLTLPSNEVMRADQTLEELQKLGEDGWEVSTKLYETGVTSILLLKRQSTHSISSGAR